MLTIDGEIHITHKNKEPFSKWEIVKLADNIGLVFVEKVPFNISDYPFYVNKRGSGENCDGTFPIGDSSTFKTKICEINFFGAKCCVRRLRPRLARLIFYFLF
jgi:25S rRNA (uracil2634-N3)-methyltransferase